MIDLQRGRFIIHKRFEKALLGICWMPYDVRMSALPKFAVCMSVFLCCLIVILVGGVSRNCEWGGGGLRGAAGPILTENCSGMDESPPQEKMFWPILCPLHSLPYVSFSALSWMKKMGPLPPFIRHGRPKSPCTFSISPGTNVPAGTLNLALTGWGLRGGTLALPSLGGIRDEAPEAGEFPEGFFASTFLDTPLMRYANTTSGW